MVSEAGFLADFNTWLESKNPNEKEFLQAAGEVVASIAPIYLRRKEWRKARILERLTEPDRIISFRVCWEDDRGAIQINRGWRVQFSHVLGPYKGGIRFSPTVNQSVLKFLGFEQILKNSLTGLPMGGGKGGSDFDPKGKSDREIMRFCQSFMNELHRHIGPDIDVPAGDIGVGVKEISYMFGRYLQLTNNWNGGLTGKGSTFGGSVERPAATGYGVIYFCANMLAERGQDLEGKRIVISGSGNVALHAAAKAIELGGKVLTLSNSDGFALFEDGMSKKQIESVLKMTERGSGRLDEFALNEKNVLFYRDKRPWAIACDLALPCAIQNELNATNVSTLVDNGVEAIVEGSNMPLTKSAMEVVKGADITYVPGKAANAGGVAVSGFELSQNAGRVSWSYDEVDSKLKNIMKTIHDACVEHGSDGKKTDYVAGANIAGFKRVATAMHAYGIF